MRILIKFMKPYRRRIALMFALLLFQALGTLIIPTLMSDIVNRGILIGDTAYIGRTGFVMLLAAVLVAGISIAHIYLSSDNAALIGRDIRNAVFRKTQELSVYDFDRFGAASMITRCTSDVTQIQAGFATIVELVLPAPFMTIAGLLLTFSKDRALTLLLVCIMALILFLTLLLSKKAIPMFDKLLVMMDEMNRCVLEKISGVRVIRAFNRDHYEKGRMDDTFTQYANMGIKINRLFAVLMPLITLIMNLCTLLIIGLGNSRIRAAGMELGDLYAIIEYATITLTFLIMGLSSIMTIPRLNISAGRIAEVLAAENSIPDTGSGRVKREDPVELEFCDVSFGYGDAEKPVLSHISFSIHKGQTTAIIGSTGSGKSTVLNLLMRFYDPVEGHILLGEKDIRELPLADYRASIGYVPQKVFLFSGTITDNLRHGNENATEDDMMAAIRTAQLSEFIGGSKAGLQTRVSQGGVNFSGGQRQRLAIARAIIRKPSIYVFDDSFSALDFKTDAMLRKALKPETGEAAVLIVAQRINTIMDAHRIIVLEDGKIVGSGTHKELMEHCPAYRQIARSQMREVPQ
ncbi:MAG: ABC transporter ATP-binding protein/permease [Clostridium sp.]|nr:ABC transporter ATP-binding protein/permease [Acetatifactor muris]MCM1527921.1 ABC transporter ATP-binding protein/permease [Bacteroides sp.]MCM1564014.1 ABC transporter ATP-binding protein/permease [Clostridium sp.]